MILERGLNSSVDLIFEYKSEDGGVWVEIITLWNCLHQVVYCVRWSGHVATLLQVNISRLNKIVGLKLSFSVFSKYYIKYKNKFTNLNFFKKNIYYGFYILLLK